MSSPGKWGKGFLSLILTWICNVSWKGQKCSTWPPASHKVNISFQSNNGCSSKVASSWLTFKQNGGEYKTLNALLAYETSRVSACFIYFYPGLACFSYSKPPTQSTKREPRWLTLASIPKHNGNITMLTLACASAQPTFGRCLPAHPAAEEAHGVADGWGLVTPSSSSSRRLPQLATVRLHFCVLLFSRR